VEGVAFGLPAAEVWRGRRVLLTGHTGFKGAWLAMWLCRLGAEVAGISLPAEPGGLGAMLAIERRVASHRIDIRDGAGLSGVVADFEPSVVFHLAAQSLVRRSYVEPIATVATNVLGTANVLEACRACRSVRAVIVVTSDKCYQNQGWHWPYRESDQLGGHDPYSASKAAAELVTASWRLSFLAEAGVAVASARAGNVIGGGDMAPDRLVPDCVRAFAAGDAARIRNPSATRPWQHVLDPLCGYLLLAERLLAGEDVACAWNFGPGETGVRTVRELVTALADAWGGECRWEADPGDHPHEAHLLALDSTRAQVHLGWRPRLAFADSVRMTARWYRRQFEGADAAELVAADIARYTGEAGQ
jgi:CDP-glucose 4,6-dehydratase